MKKIHFTKMHGLGNDFVIIDAINQKDISFTPKQIQQLSDRHLGIGFDQLLIVEKARTPDTDFYYRIFNADGSEVGQCGNGARCFTKFVLDKGLTQKNKLILQTKTHLLKTEMQPDGRIRVEMGIPTFEKSPNISYQNQAIKMFVLDLGNPHALIMVDNIDTAPVASLGKFISEHSDFPEGVNVGFMQIINPKEIRLRVYERGAGETLACGSGACAAAVIGIMHHDLHPQLTVHLTGGDLEITWADPNQSIWMVGEATTSFEGNFILND